MKLIGYALSLIDTGTVMVEEVNGRSGEARFLPTQSRFVTTAHGAYELDEN